MPAATDNNAKPVNGPLGDRSRERLLRRDEEPVDVGSTYRSAAINAGAPGSPSENVSATAYPAATTGPKRVPTVTIRPDQGVASSDRTASRGTPQSQAPLPPPPRQAAASPPPNYTPPPVGEAKVASVAPAALAPEATPSRAIEAGGFFVQVSSQRSEAEAQAAFRALQAKYPALSGHDLLIRRKDLGERGTFFAAQVGPFSVKSEADQLCDTLKAAGGAGACFVQRN
jgi:hypothetical protein